MIYIIIFIVLIILIIISGIPSSEPKYSKPHIERKDYEVIYKDNKTIESEFYIYWDELCDDIYFKTLEEAQDYIIFASKPIQYYTTTGGREAFGTDINGDSFFILKEKRKNGKFLKKYYNSRTSSEDYNLLRDFVKIKTFINQTIVE